jgi:hypothetical protein
MCVPRGRRGGGARGERWHEKAAKNIVSGKEKEREERRKRSGGAVEGGDDRRSLPRDLFPAAAAPTRRPPPPSAAPGRSLGGSALLIPGRTHGRRPPCTCTTRPFGRPRASLLTRVVVAPTGLIWRGWGGLVWVALLRPPSSRPTSSSLAPAALPHDQHTSTTTATVGNLIPSPARRCLAAAALLPTHRFLRPRASPSLPGAAASSGSPSVELAGGGRSKAPPYGRRANGGRRGPSVRASAASVWARGRRLTASAIFPLSGAYYRSPPTRPAPPYRRQLRARKPASSRDALSVRA